MQTTRKVTMRDVARALGVHASTVSLALRGHPSIPSATRERVAREAAAQGYVPDPFLTALAEYRRAGRPARATAVIAWVNRWTPSARLYAHREFVRYFEGAESAGRELGYQMDRFDLGDAPLSVLSRMLRARNVAAVILPPHHGACNDWAEMDWSSTAVVRIGHSVRVPAHAVACDQVGAAMLGVQRMLERGYKRIGFVTARGSELSTRFGAGFLFARDRLPGLERLPVLTLDDEALSDRERTLARWLSKYRPDVIFTSHSEVPVLLARLAIRVPADLGLAVTSVLDGGCDTGIDQRATEIGRAAVELLDAQLSRGRFGLPEFPRMITVSATWCEGTCLPSCDTQLKEYPASCAASGESSKTISP